MKKQSFIGLLCVLCLSSCYAKNAGEEIYEHLGKLLEDHQVSFEEVEITDSNELSRDMIKLAVYYPDPDEVLLSIPNSIKLIRIIPHERESSNKGDFTWKVNGDDFMFSREFEKLPYDAYAVGLSKRIDSPLSPAMKGTEGLIKALRDLGKSQKEAEKLIADIKAELTKLSSEELFLKSCKVFPGLLKKKKDIKKATELALLILIRDSTGVHGKVIYYFRLNNNIVYINLFESSTGYSGQISVYEKNENLLWTG